MTVNAEGELPRDLFQFVCGVCWAFFMQAAFQRRVGIVFLVYLLFHTQHPEKCAVPVNLQVIEALVALREECECSSVFLECPKILHDMMSSGSISIGIRATCRNLFFSRRGQLGERYYRDKAVADETEVHLDAKGEQADSVSSRGVPSQRLHVQPTAAGPKQDGPLAGALMTQDGQEIINFDEILIEAQTYDANNALNVRDGCEATTDALSSLSRAAGIYQRDTQPEPQQLAFAEGVSSQTEEMPPSKSKKKKQNRVQSDSDDSLFERTTQPVPYGTVEAARLQSELEASGQPIAGPVHGTKFRRKQARQSRLIGLDKALKKLKCRSDAAPPSSSSAANMDDHSGVEPYDQ